VPGQRLGGAGPADRDTGATEYGLDQDQAACRGLAVGRRASRTPSAPRRQPVGGL